MSVFNFVKLGNWLGIKYCVFIFLPVANNWGHSFVSGLAGPSILVPLLTIVSLNPELTGLGLRFELGSGLGLGS